MNGQQGPVEVTVWYQRNRCTRDLGMGWEWEPAREMLDLNDLTVTHAPVRNDAVPYVEGADLGAKNDVTYAILADAFEMGQAEFGMRLPTGGVDVGRGPEQIGHTSMMVGDLVELRRAGVSHVWFCDSLGWVFLANRNR